MNKNGALYIRVSTDKQEELSPDAQRRLLLDYAKQHNIIIANEMIFQDNGISGRKAEKRPEFMRMISTAKSPAHPIDIILVWKFSRFARNQEEAIVYKSMLKKQCDVDVVSITEPIIDGVFGTLIERIIEWMDEYYSINLSQEVKRGMTENALRGGYQSSPCLGYRSEKSGEPFVVYPPEKEIVTYIFEEYANGKDATAISRYLNEHGFHLRRGGLFEKRKIDRIIQNRFYIGKVIWNGIERNGKHETFISEELFQRANERLQSVNYKVKARNISSCKHWLSGILKCNTCGATLCYSQNSCYAYFICWKYSKGYHPESCSISAKLAERAVLDYIKIVMNGKQYDYKVIKRKSSLDSIDSIQKELDKISISELRIKNAYEASVYTLEEFKESRERLQSKRKKLESLLSQAQPQDETVNNQERIQNIYDTLTSDSISYEEKGMVIRTVVDSITYDKASNTMYFRLLS